MLALKAWTAALRTGRAFLTPLARGLVDPKQCGDKGNNQPGLRCWFEALVPACEEGAQRARPPPPQLVFNLPQLHRESLATAAAVPAPFAALGAFWWTTQYTARLMRPAPRLRSLLEVALLESGLGAALAAGPVAGFHVRHGGCNLMHPRLQPCVARGCNPMHSRLLSGALWYSGWLSPLQVRHGDSCIAAEAARTARRCEPLSRYVDAVAPYLEQHGVRTVFLATDSEEAPHIYIYILRAGTPSYTSIQMHL